MTILFDESKHPREHGRFTNSYGGGDQSPGAAGDPASAPAGSLPRRLAVAAELEGRLDELPPDEQAAATDAVESVKGEARQALGATAAGAAQPSPSPTSAADPLIPARVAAAVDAAHANVLAAGDEHARLADEATQRRAGLQAERDRLLAASSAGTVEERAAAVAKLKGSTKAIAAATKEIAAHQEAGRAACLRQLAAANPGGVELTGATTKKIEEGRQLFNSIAGDGHKLEAKGAINSLPGRGRAYADPEAHAVQVGGERPAIVVHELAHHVEFNDPAIFAACKEFRTGRATGDARPLGELTAGTGQKYASDEVAVPGKFFDPYCGKVYADEAQTHATEVLTMGVQRMVEDPHGFAKEDPGYFKFTLAQLRRRNGGGND